MLTYVWQLYDAMAPHLPHAQPVVLYGLFLGWLYLFYAPFLNVSKRERADNLYAQVVKLLHAWSSVHVILLHVVPAYGNYLHHPDVQQSSIGGVFVGFVAAFASFFRWWHWGKRSLSLKITYAPTLLQQALNSVTIAAILTVHHFACEMAAPPAEMSLVEVAVCQHKFHGGAGGLVVLFLGGVLCVMMDYGYKCHFDCDLNRGILSGDRVSHKRAAPNHMAVAHKVMRFNVSGDCSRDSDEDQPDGEEMVSWYGILAAQTGLKALLGKSMSFGKFDYRSMEAELGPKHFVINGQTDDAAKQRPRVVRNLSGDLSVLQASPTGRSPSGEDFWFDFVADIGDGFNSTYTVASALAQKRLFVGDADLSAAERARRLARYVRDTTKEFVMRGRRREGMTPYTSSATPVSLPPRAMSEFNFSQRSEVAAESVGTSSVTPMAVSRRAMSEFRSRAFVTAPHVDKGEESNYLPRGRLLLVGGDLCYPMPTIEGFFKKWYKVYNDALPAPRGTALPHKRPHSVAAHGDKVAMNLQPDSQPVMFVIPGNHDWIDGLETYRSTVLTFDRLGGWKTPQTTSYFVLELPHKWWILNVDAGMGTDIDQLQMQYFLHFIRDLPADASVVLLCHDPNWINDALNLHEKEPRTQIRVSTLADALGARLRMRLCGDIHNYTRYEYADEETPKHSPLYVVSGGGGAFLHGCTQPGKFMKIYGKRFERKGCYPPPKKRLAFRWALRFRLVNWKFDIFGSLLYCAIVMPLLPVSRFRSDPVAMHADPNVALSWPGLIDFWCSIFQLSGELITRFLTESFMTQFIGAAVILGAFAQTDGNASSVKRWMLSIIHGSVHIALATFLLAVLSLTFDRAVMLGMTKSDATAWRPATMLVVRGPIEGLLAACGSPCQSIATWFSATTVAHWLEVALGSLDIVEGLAYLHAHVSAPTMAAVTTRTWLLYYGHVMWFYWLLAAPAVSLVIGLYMFVCVSYLGVSLEHAYAAFQVEDWKNFLRIRIDSTTRELDVHVIGFRKIARHWRRDPRHDVERLGNPGVASHERDHPSVWAPVGDRSRPKVVDRFIVAPTPRLPPRHHAAASRGAGARPPHATKDDSATLNSAPK